MQAVIVFGDFRAMLGLRSSQCEIKHAASHGYQILGVMIA